jgi:hypothetical protein
LTLLKSREKTEKTRRGKTRGRPEENPRKIQKESSKLENPVENPGNLKFVHENAP